MASSLVGSNITANGPFYVFSYYSYSINACRGRRNESVFPVPVLDLKNNIIIFILIT